MIKIKMIKTILWIKDSYFSWKQKFKIKNVLIMNLFIALLTAPIHHSGSIGEQVMSC